MGWINKGRKKKSCKGRKERKKREQSTKTCEEKS